MDTVAMLALQMDVLRAAEAAAARGERAAVPGAAEAARALLAAPSPGNPDLSAARILDLAAFAMMAGEGGLLAGRAPALPEGRDWYERVLLSAARAWLDVASGAPGAAGRADAAHVALVAEQASEEARFLAAAERPRRAALMLLSVCFLSHAARLAGNGDAPGAADALRSASEAAGPAEKLPVAVAADTLALALRVAPEPTAALPAPGA